MKETAWQADGTTWYAIRAGDRWKETGNQYESGMMIHSRAASARQ